MSQNILMIDVPTLKGRMPIHDNVDEKLINPEIKAAQDSYIEPLLGTALFNKIINAIADASISSGPLADYKTLLDSYLVDTICNYVMSELPDGINFQFTNKGVIGKTSENSTQPSISDLYTIVGKYKNRAEHYAKRAKMYLLAQVAAGKFPEYLNPGQTIDTVIPEKNTFSSPIYLENSTRRRRSFEERNQGNRPNCD